ncbi:hypothetical protein P4O66_015849 [Electrophorus voltai]|uniref:Uncharacterized protein n=1 Tax=Electrophorus voltai TaxID=2609070 RepID=A0AAD8YX14_9TELE|nr:hypothetical protein P4O66_015849 [Electrophorus voltai]
MRQGDTLAGAPSRGSEQGARLCKVTRCTGTESKVTRLSQVTRFARCTLEGTVAGDTLGQVTAVPGDTLQGQWQVTACARDRGKVTRWPGAACAGDTLGQVTRLARELGKVTRLQGQCQVARLARCTLARCTLGKGQWQGTVSKVHAWPGDTCKGTESKVQSTSWMPHQQYVMQPTYMSAAAAVAPMQGTYIPQYTPLPPSAVPVEGLVTEASQTVASSQDINAPQQQIAVETSDHIPPYSYQSKYGLH